MNCLRKLPDKLDSSAITLKPRSAREALGTANLGSHQPSLFDEEIPLSQPMAFRINKLTEGNPDSHADTMRELIFRDFTSAIIEKGGTKEDAIAAVIQPALTEPVNYNEQIGKATSALRVKSTVAGVIDRTDGRRVDYMKVSGAPVEALGILGRTVVYNSGFAPTAVQSKNPLRDAHSDPYAEAAVALNLNWSSLRDIRDASLENLVNAGVEVWQPSHLEPSSAYLNLAYACRAVGSENVICVNTNKGMSDAIKRTQRTLGHLSAVPEFKKSTLGLQDHILRCVDWERVGEAIGVELPSDEMGIATAPSGSKGLTLYACAILSEARGRMKDSWIVLHDTDIINPDHYGAIAYLGLPLIFGSNNPNSKGWGAFTLVEPGQDEIISRFIAHFAKFYQRTNLALM